MNQMSNIRPQADISGSRIAYISAGWHKDIVEQAQLSFTAHIEKNGLSAQSITHFDVPGSLEIPLQAKLLANSGQYDVIVAAGLIVDGGIYRHDFVASSVIDGLMRVQLDTEVPILSVILTPHHFHEHEEHQKYFFEHFKVKGVEAAQACLQTLGNMRALKKAA